MRDGRASAAVLMGCALIATLTACASTPAPADRDDDRIRRIERERLRALVDADLLTARRLHSDDFQLITPAGIPLTKDEYLAGIADGQPDYIAWEAGDIQVKMRGDLAVIRYRDVRFDVNAGGRPVHRGPMYHTNVYELRGGEWKAVWSQASGVIKLQ